MKGVKLPQPPEIIADTTLKPLRDRAIAQDGALVVLRADASGALTLHHGRGLWHFLRHLPAGTERGAEGWCWRGTWYPLAGHLVATRTISDSVRTWNELYDELLAVRSDPAEWIAPALA